MNKQSEEDYLDKLLDSVNQEEKRREMVSVDREFLKELQMAKTGQDVWKFGANRFRLELENAAKGEAEFLREFEQELEDEEFEDMLKELDDGMEDFTLEELVRTLRSSDGLGLGKHEPETPKEPEPEKVDTYEEDTYEADAYEPITYETDVAEEEPDLSLDTPFGMGVDTEEEPDLSELGEEDLISLLAGTEDLADLGALLSQSDSEQPIDAEDPFAAFASNEMSMQAEALEDKSEDAQKKKEKGKKGGFFDKISALLFGKDDADDTEEKRVSLSTAETNGVEYLSDENAQILAAFADINEIGDIGNAGGKGKKDKKEKKKEPKPKKAAKPKAPKKPKAKKPKEIDNTPPLPKGPVVLVGVLAASILVFVYFGTELISYQSAVSKAKSYFRDGMYTEAANSMSGIVVKKGDELLHNKVITLAAADSELSSYKVFIKHDKKAEALDALVSAAGRCEINSENAELFSCTGELNILRDEVTVELQEQFGMSYAKALELYELTEDSRTEYTIALNEVMEELGIK